MIGGTLPYAYYFNDTLITNPIISGLAAGTYTDSIIDDNGCTSNTDTFNVTYNGIGELNISEFNIYPNPTSDKVTIDLNNQKSESFNIKISNVLGQVVFSEIKHYATNAKETATVEQKRRREKILRPQQGRPVRMIADRHIKRHSSNRINSRSIWFVLCKTFG